MKSQSIKKLTESFAKFPSIGPKQAAKFVFFLLKNREIIDEFIINLKNLKNNVKVCKQCFLKFEDDKSHLCPICQDKNRNQNLICVVENDEDAYIIEQSKIFEGVYHILGGVLNPMKKINSDNLNIKALIKRIEDLKKQNSENNIEVIIATNPTTEGEITRLFLEKELKPFNIKVTHPARGIATGSTIEYIDENTLLNAFKNRK